MWTYFSETSLNYIINDLRDIRDNSDSESQSNELVLTDGDILVKIGNLLLHSDLSEAHKTVFVSGTFDGSSTAITKPKTVNKQIGGKHGDQDDWWNYPDENYYVHKGQGYSTSVEDVTISSIERVWM